MQKRKTLIDVFPDWMTGGGVFSALQTLDVPWKDENIASILDLEYYGNISGDKNTAPLINKYMSGDELTAQEILTLATLIFKINAVTWAKEWATLSAEYDPIENYSMREVMTDDETVIEYGKTHTRTDNTTKTRTPNLSEVTTPDLTVEETPDLTEEETPDLTTENDNSVYGFNSATAVPTGEQSTTQTGTNTKTTTGTNTTTTTGTNTVATTGTDTVRDTGTVTDVDTGDDTHTRNYELTRSGNIGVTTSQQMLESERNLWMWNFFYGVVFPAIDRVLTIQIY